MIMDYLFNEQGMHPVMKCSCRVLIVPPLMMQDTEAREMSVAEVVDLSGDSPRSGEQQGG